MSRKKTFKPDPLASIGGSDTFLMIYNSMIMSEAFKNLSLSGKLMLMYCKNQASSKEGRACLYQYKKAAAEEETENINDQCFVFPAAHMEKYGIQRQNGSRYLRELERAGFIKKLYANQHRHKVNIYQFSNDWKG